jgi:uncharacterized protein
LSDLILSRFNVYVNPFRENGTCLVYNTLSSSAVELPSLEDRIRLDHLSGTEIQELRRAMILVDSPEHESKILNYWSRLTRHGRRGLVATIFTTRQCNLACSYCYERHDGSQSPSKHMELSTADRVAGWIRRYVAAKGLSEIHLTWYGGEPLCNLPVVEAIGDDLLDFSRRHNVMLRTYLITNGTLVSDDVAERLRRYNLVQSQITLDGPENCHDARRVRLDASGSYADTLRGLSILSRYGRTVIRCNVNDDVLPHVPRLLEELAALGFAQKRNTFTVAATFVWDCESGCPGVDVDQRSYASRSISILRQAKALGFGIRNPFNISPCFGVREASFSFDVDGSIYTCAQMAGRPGACVGHTDESAFAETYYDLLLSDPRSPECSQCAYYPICIGGCRAWAMHTSHDLNAVRCAKDSYAELVPEILRVVYE